MSIRCCNVQVTYHDVGRDPPTFFFTCGHPRLPEQIHAPLRSSSKLHDGGQRRQRDGQGKRRRWRNTRIKLLSIRFTQLEGAAERVTPAPEPLCDLSKVLSEAVNGVHDPPAEFPLARNRSLVLPTLASGPRLMLLGFSGWRSQSVGQCSPTRSFKSVRTCHCGFGVSGLPPDVAREGDSLMQSR